MTIEGARLAAMEQADDRRETCHRPGPDAICAPAAPLGPDRGPDAVALWQVAPLAAGPGDEQHRVDHLAPSDHGRCPTTSGRIEQFGDQLPLLVGQGDRETHGCSITVGRVSSSGTIPPIRTAEFSYRPLDQHALAGPPSRAAASPMRI